MSFPFDHHHNHHSHHHSHHHRRDDDNEEYPNYPPPPSSDYPPPPGGPYPPPSNYPPPPFDGPHPPPQQPPYFGGSYPPPPQPPLADYPPPPGVYHSSHTNPYDSSSSYEYAPPPPPVVTIPEHHHHGGGGSHHFDHRPEMGSTHHYGPGSELGELGGKPSCGLYCKAGGDRFAVAIRDGKLVLTYADVNDPTQHWIKDEKYSTKVKDKDGYPSFSLVNKGTKHALKHSVSAHPVQLTEYKPEFFDVSVLWTESNDLGDGYRTIRTVNNTKLVMDAFHGDKDHGGVHDGTIVALYESWKGDNQNQQWKLIPF